MHARLFEKMNATVCAVLGSTATSAQETAAELTLALGHPVAGFSDLDLLLAQPLDAISICTPPTLHVEQIMAAFDAGVPVFCEKPLFWWANINLNAVDETLSTIEAHSQRALFVNTSNTVFAQAALARVPETLTSVVFRFHTQGRYTARDIALDLLPHGISILLALFGERPLSTVRHRFNDTACRSTFTYGDCSVEFDFRQKPDQAKHLSLELNGRAFTRIQQGLNDSYQAFLMAADTRQKIPIRDPFAVYIADFLDYCQDQAPRRQDAFDEAALNLRLMAQAMIRGEWAEVAAP